jgi:RNA 2',3'-cyclic 3'-phosphodiesterase
LEGHHYFFALSLPQHIKEYLHDRCEQVKMDFPFKRWVHQEDYHITLAFLGHAPKDQLEKANMFIKEAINHLKGFELSLHQLGVFGRKEVPRILWAGVNESQELNGLRKTVYESCLQAGFHLDTKPFKPHITLARNWIGNDRFPIEKLKNVMKEDFHFSAEKVVLYETHLDLTPKYVTKKEYKLVADTV